MKCGKEWVPESTEAGAVSPHPIGILLVDDQEDLRTMLGRVLGAAGFDVTQAGSGEEALEILAGCPSRIRMLITDIMMPGIDGCELATRVVERMPHIRVLFMSGCADVSVPERAPFLKKPFGAHALLDTVSELLSGRERAAGI